MGSRDELIQYSIPFLREVKDMTPGAEMERWLNERYGEGSQLYQDLARLNLVVPLDKGAELKGLQGWQGPGWTAPDPGSRHYPEVRGGAVIALFYLPAGRISYDFAAPS